MEAAGIESAGDIGRNIFAEITCADSTGRRAANALQQGCINWQQVSLSDTKLQLVVSSWHRLPQVIRDAIANMAISQAALSEVD